MKPANCPYEAHLNFREFSIPAGGEHALQLTGWTVFQVRKGTGYYLHQQVKLELEPGSVLLAARALKGIIRASQLGELSLDAFIVIPARLTGLITFTEQALLERASSRKENCLQLFPPRSPVAEKLGELQTDRNQDGLLFRLELLRLFVQMLGNELQQTTPGQEAADARTRLHTLLKKTPALELIEMNFSELAQKTRCTARHLSRIFHELVGMSFNDKRAELRLERARELLATCDSKIVDVALESGFKSLSFFNLMFVRHFGISPGKWRHKQATGSKHNGGQIATKSESENHHAAAFRVIFQADPRSKSHNNSGQRNPQRFGQTRPTKGVVRR